jgi:uncharacterized protein YjbI with pentapeptide repeats
VDQEQKPSKRLLIRELVPDWRPSRKQVLWTVRIVIVLVVLLGLLTLIGLPFGITLWEWVKLLIVPAVIAAGGIWFNRQQRQRELAIAEQRSQDGVLQAYLEQMSQLLTDKERPLRRAQPGDDISTVARARTLTALTRLDGTRKRSVLQFLYESRLIDKDRVVLDLERADLSKADLREANLPMVRLLRVDLSEADLTGANLYKAILGTANLSEADLSGAGLFGAWLSGANLTKANLSWAHLTGANLTLTKLSGAYLTKANLSEANVSQWQLDQAASLEGATMPDGQKYEDWLKSKDRGENGENSGSS